MGMKRSGSIALELSCNTQLRCLECGQQNFRICMDADEETDEVSTTVVNNVECSNCHALYQVKFLERQGAGNASDGKGEER
jgi:transcription elongation factor Elf1